MVRWYDPRMRNLWEVLAASIVAGAALILWRLVAWLMGR